VNVSRFQQLEANGRFTLCIWPEHCLVGSNGHSVQPDIFSAINAWERSRVNAARYFVKGNNSLTEHYSAIKADVIVEDDPSTGVNNVLVNSLKEFDRVIICGQALS
jgi:nicotinamidase/pyrazinamidase